MESKCGCACVCHGEEAKPEWPGPCAACCDPELGEYACDCSRAIAASLAKDARTFAELVASLTVPAAESRPFDTLLGMPVRIVADPVDPTVGYIFNEEVLREALRYKPLVLIDPEPVEVIPPWNWWYMRLNDILP